MKTIASSFKKDFKWFFLLVFFLLILRSVFLEPYRIPTGSMMPTLINGDFILVNKMTYGFKVPFSDVVFNIPFTRVTINLEPIYLYRDKKPKRGEVIVFKYPVDQEINYIKRIVAIPGDELEIKKKQLYLNGKKLFYLQIDDKELRNDFELVFKDYSFDLFRAKIDETEYLYQLNRGNFFNQNYAKIVIPEGKYFVMGDNRDFSYDSRSWGLVDFKQIKGKAILVWFSLTLPGVETYFNLNFRRIGQKL